MKTSTKIIIGLLIVLGLVMWYCICLYNKAKESKSVSPIEAITKKKIETEAKEIRKEVDKNGLAHVIYKMVKEIDQSAVDKIRADLLDTTDQLNIARERIKQVSVINTSLAIKNQKLEKKVSELATTYIHTDDNFRLAVNVPNDTAISATFNAGYDADLITTQYTKGSWPFGVHTYMDIYSNDPRFTIKGARTFTVKQKQPLFGLRLQASGQYNPKSKDIGFGPGARLDLSRFSLQGNYTYFPSQGKWIPNITSSFDLVRF